MSKARDLASAHAGVTALAVVSSVLQDAASTGTMLPVRVAVGGVEQFSGWSVDAATGIVTFSSPPAMGAAVTAGFKFDVPVRFDSDLNRGQVWDISASVNNVDRSTRKFLSASLIATDTSARTLVVPHEFLYTPDYSQVQLTLDDRSTPSGTPPQYLVVNNIDSTNITIAYKYATTPDAASNHRVHIRVG